jgi:hypothetical protein
MNVIHFQNVNKLDHSSRVNVRTNEWTDLYVLYLTIFIHKNELASLKTIHNPVTKGRIS